MSDGEHQRWDGQRRIHLIWELTQAAIALLVTSAALYAAVELSLLDAASTAGFLLLSNGFFLVIGFYFGRARPGAPGGNAVRY